MAAPAPSDRHIDAARRRLGHLAGLGDATNKAEERILEVAGDKLTSIQDDLDKLHQRALTDPDAGRQYQSLLVERGQLENIVAHARLVLGQ